MFEEAIRMRGQASPGGCAVPPVPAGASTRRLGRRFRMRGFSLVEVLISVAVLGLAMAPIVGIINRSTRQIRDEKMEATAANFAAKKLNEILTDMAFDQELINGTKAGLNGQETVDGTDVNWEATISAVAGLKFRYRKLKYHNPTGHESGETVALVYEPNPRGGGDEFNDEAKDIDAKYAGLGTVMVDVKLFLQWKPREDAAFDPRHQEYLFTRKAKLE
jgi:prepilin-type N-terminal cleavage/methylation domain-containing protein